MRPIVVGPIVVGALVVGAIAAAAMRHPVAATARKSKPRQTGAWGSQGGSSAKHESRRDMPPQRSRRRHALRAYRPTRTALRVPPGAKRRSYFAFANATVMSSMRFE